MGKKIPRKVRGVLPLSIFRHYKDNANIYIYKLFAHFFLLESVFFFRSVGFTYIYTYIRTGAKYRDF